MTAEDHRRIGYNSHTRTTRRMVVAAQLRHDWDLLRFCGVVLRRIENGGGSAAANLLPGEHYYLARLAVRVARRARKRMADEASIWGNDGDSAAEAEARKEWLSRPRVAEAQVEYPPWHREALETVDAIALDEEFRRRAIEPGTFDRAAEADLAYRDPETGRPIG